MARGLGSLLLLAACAVVLACGPSLVEGMGPLLACEDVRPLASAPDPLTHVEEDGLPVFHLFLADSLPDEKGYHTASLVYRGRCHALEARLRGQTSRAFPKRSYTLEFPESAPFDEPHLAGGLTGRRKVVLISPFNDNSYLRHRLAFTLWNRMSPEHLQVKTFSAVVYLNGRYWGLYTVADHVDRHLMAAHGLDPEGDLFKAVDWEANFSRQDSAGRPKRSLHQGYEKKAGLPKSGREAYATIRDFTAFVVDASTERFREERDAWMVARDYEDWWILSTLVLADDSVCKNAYHYRAPGPGSRWRFIPWDLDASFGQRWETSRSDPADLRDFTEVNHLFARMLEDPAIAEPLRERYRALLAGELHAEEVLGLIDAYAREIAPAARKDELHWGQAYRDFFRWRWREDFTTHEEEIEYLRGWVRTRWGELERRLP